MKPMSDSQVMQTPEQGKFRKQSFATESPAQFFLGLSLTQRYFGGLLALAAPVILVEALSARTLFLHAFARDQHLLLALLISIANAWLVAAAGMFVIERLQGRSGSIGGVSVRAVQFLPKIFLSYIIFLSFVGATFVVVPLTLFLPLFLWAPMYCIAETFAPTPEQPPLPEDEEDEEAFAEIERVFQIWKRSNFTGKRIWDLGFVRSVRFAARNPVLSFQVAALFLLMSLGPSALVAKLMGPTGGLSLTIMQVIVSSACDVFAVGIWAGSFMFSLKTAELKEIQITADGVSAFVFPRPSWTSKLRPQVGALLLMLLLALSTVSWMSLRQYAAGERIMPQSAHVDLISVQGAERGLVLEFALSDEVEQLRWFDPELLRVQYLKVDADKKVETKLLLPERVKLLDVSNKELDPNYFKPARSVHVRMVAPNVKDFSPQGFQVLYLSPIRGQKSRVLVYAKITPKQ